MERVRGLRCTRGRQVRIVGIIVEFERDTTTDQIGVNRKTGQKCRDERRRSKRRKEMKTTDGTEGRPEYAHQAVQVKCLKDAVIDCERDGLDNQIAIDQMLKFPAANATNSTLLITVKLADETPVFVMTDGITRSKSDDFSSGTADVSITVST